MRRLVLFLAGCALALTCWLAMRPANAPATSTAGVASIEPEILAAPQRSGPASRADFATRPASARAANVPKVFPGERALTTVRGSVVAADRSPIAGALVTLTSTLGATTTTTKVVDERAVHLETTTDAEGAFRFEGVPEGPCLASASLAMRTSLAVATVASRDAPPLVIRFEPAERTLEIQVVTANGALVAGAEVDLVLATPRTDAAPRGVARASSDARGIAKFVVPEIAAGYAEVRDFRGTCGAEPIAEKITVARLRLAAPSTLRGLVRRPADLPAHPGTVTAHVCMGSHLGSYQFFVARTVPSDGTTYELTGLPPATYAITWSAPGSALAPRSPAGQLVPGQVVTVPAGETTLFDLELVAAGSLTGRAVDETGAGIADAGVTLVRRGVPYEPWSWLGAGAPFERFDSQPWTHHENPSLVVHTQTAADGRFASDGLAPGDYAVTVADAGRATWSEPAIAVAAGSCVEVVARLVPAGALQLAVDPGAHVGVLPEGSQRAACAFVAPEHGVCTLADLPAGPYAICLLRPEPETIAKTTVVAHRTTWLDLRNRGRFVLRGRVVASAAAIAGAEVGTAWQRVVTDADGRFELRNDAPWTRSEPWLVQVLHGGARWTFPVAASEEPLVLELGSATQRIVLLDASGRSAPARVEATSEDPQTHVRFEGAWNSVDGTVFATSLPHGTLHWRASFADGATLERAADARSTSSVTLQAPLRGAIEVWLVDAHGVPLPGIQVGVLGGSEEAWWGRFVATTDVAGRALLRGVPLAPLTVGAFHWMVTGDDEATDPVPATVTPGRPVPTRVELRMRR